MRQSHQKSRSRGRNRKPQNPLSRNYESNGPDVKIRGNAGHIAEKYASLARDALSNGDTVMAENYLQHAEHYNRLIAAAQAQRAEEQAQQAASRGPQPDVEESEDGNTEATSAGKNTEDSQEAASAETDERGKGQKSGRGRRSRRPAAEDDQVAAGSEEDAASEDNGKNRTNGSGSDEDAPQVQEDVKAGDADVISDDAASLPDSITGGLRAEEA